MTLAPAWRVMEPPASGPGERGRLRILCVEDNPLIAEMLERLLALAGHAPELARDGEEAWWRVAADPADFDLVLTDHQMPRADGLALVRRLRRTRFHGRIIVHSSALDPAEREAYVRLGIDAFVAKGTDSEEILETIARVCGREP